MEDCDVSFNSILAMDTDEMAEFLSENLKYNNMVFENTKKQSLPPLQVTNEKSRVFIFVAWLPVGRNSSHIRSLLNIVEIYQSKSIECIFIITGMEFTHHRGLSFYLDKTVDELNNAFRAVFNAINPPDFSLLKIEYAVSKDSDVNDIQSQRERVIKIFRKYNFTPDDLLFCITGILSCRFCHAYLASYHSTVIAFAHNAKDNLGYLSRYANYVVMPSLRSEKLVSDLKKQCKPDCNIYENIAPSKPFSWQVINKSKLSKDELAIIPKLKDSITLISANARFNDIEPEFFEFFEIMKQTYPDVIFKYLLVGFDSKKPAKFQPLPESGYITLSWTEDLYSLISQIKSFGKTIYCYPVRSDSGGSNRMAYLARVPVILFDTNDAVSAIPNESVVKDLSEFNLRLARYVFDNDYYFDYESRIKGHDFDLKVKAQELFMSFFNSNKVEI